MQTLVRFGERDEARELYTEEQGGLTRILESDYISQTIICAFV